MIGDVPARVALVQSESGELEGRAHARLLAGGGEGCRVRRLGGVRSRGGLELRGAYDAAAGRLRTYSGLWTLCAQSVDVQPWVPWFCADDGSSPSRRRQVFLSGSRILSPHGRGWWRDIRVSSGLFVLVRGLIPSQRGLSDCGGNIRDGPRRPQLRSDHPDLQSNKEEEDDSGRFWTATSEWTTMLLQAPARNEQIEPSARAHIREDSAGRSTSRKAERMRLECVLSAVRGTTRGKLTRMGPEETED